MIASKNAENSFVKKFFPIQLLSKNFEAMVFSSEDVIFHSRNGQVESIKLA
jgi:hypothetical protein